MIFFILPSLLRELTNEGCYGNKWAIVLRDKEILEAVASLPTFEGSVNHLPSRMKWLWGGDRGKVLRHLSTEQEHLLVPSSQCLPDVLPLVCGEGCLWHLVPVSTFSTGSGKCHGFYDLWKLQHNVHLFLLCSFNFRKFTSGWGFIEQYLWASPGACPSCRIPQKIVLWSQMICWGSWLAVVVMPSHVTLDTCPNPFSVKGMVVMPTPQSCDMVKEDSESRTSVECFAHREHSMTGLSGDYHCVSYDLILKHLG